MKSIEKARLITLAVWLVGIIIPNIIGGMIAVWAAGILIGLVIAERIYK